MATVRLTLQNESLPAECSPRTPFVSDGCSGGLTATWRLLFKTNPPFEGCCDEHDYAYWKGGFEWQRKVADIALRDCIASKGYPRLARVIYAAVRLFGGPHWPHRWRWGNSCPYRMSMTYPKPRGST